VRSDDLAIEPGRIRGMTSLVVKVRSKSGLTFNRTSRATLEGGDAFVVHQPSPAEVLVRLYYAARGPARTKLTISTIHPNPGLIAADGGLDIFPTGPLPDVTITSPILDESGTAITTAGSTLLAGTVSPLSASDIQLLNLTLGTTLPIELTFRPELGLIEFRATLALAPGTNDFALSVFDPTNCFPGPSFCVGIALKLIGWIDEALHGRQLSTLRGVPRAGSPG
jgi:hypothetical protein